MANHNLPEPPRHAAVFNLLTGMAILMSILCLAWTAVVFIEPNSPVNPFPPRGSLPVNRTLSPAVSASIPAPSRTPSPTAEPTPTATESPTATAATRTPTLTVTPTSAFPFVLAPAGVRATVAFQGCAWQGVAGQVLDPLGVPIPNLSVHLEGKLDAQTLFVDKITAHLNVYGDGSFEFTLGDHPIPSENTIWIQLLDSAKKPLSDRIYLTTYEGCDRNLSLVDFQQTPP